jgi:hypothetical protein
MSSRSTPVQGVESWKKSFTESGQLPSKVQCMILQLYWQGMVCIRSSGRLDPSLERCKIDKNFYRNLSTDKRASHVDEQVCEYADGRRESLDGQKDGAKH